MSDIPIQGMDFRQLRNEVQLLRDELAIMQRKYEDILYNLDDDNFSDYIKKEKENMKTEIIINEEGIKTKVDKAFNFEKATMGDGEPTSSTDKTRLYYNQSNNRYYYFDDITQLWKEVQDGTIYSAFEQTATGFNLSGNVRIDGNTVITENLKLSGTVTWDMNNSPVKSMYSQYNLGNPNTHPAYWHSLFQTNDKYMVVSFDGGSNWGNVTKIVGTDATVSPQNVFNALTAGGTQQGLFPWFDAKSGSSQLYINAEWIQAGTITGITIGTKKNTFNDGIVLDSINQQLNFYYTQSKVGTCYPSLGQFYIGGSNGARLTLGGGSSGNKNNLLGYWDFSGATVSGLSATFG